MSEPPSPREETNLPSLGPRGEGWFVLQIVFMGIVLVAGVLVGANWSGAPRFAGAVLAACDEEGVPWHRVVRSDGSLAKGARQRQLLEAEGVPFRGRRVDMEHARVPSEIWR